METESLAKQENPMELQAGLDAMELKIKNNEKLSEEDIKFIGGLGWFSAAAVTIATIAASSS